MQFHTVKIRNLKMGYSQPTRVMGVINLSPESFYQESIVTDSKNLIDVIHRMEKEGVDLFDIGAASTAPKALYGTPTISVSEELKRVKKTMEVIRETTDHPISIDTKSAKVAETALDLGADAINDISGLSSDSRMAQLVAEREIPVILMSICENPCESLQASINSIKQSIERAISCGVPENHIIIDPGIGFGKPLRVDLSLLKNLRRFAYFGHPVLVGVSRKAFIGEILNLQNPVDRLTGTIAATSIAVMNGANVIRAHDVSEATMAVKIGESLRKSRIDTIDNIKLLGMCDEREVEIVIDCIGTSPSIIKSLSQKALILNVFINGLKPSAALIIKQEMLALGGDAAYHHDVIDSQVESTDVLIMGTPLQIERLATKMKTMTYFGLKRIGETISKLLSNRELNLG